MYKNMHYALAARLQTRFAARFGQARTVNLSASAVLHRSALLSNRDRLMRLPTNYLVAKPQVQTPSSHSHNSSSLRQGPATTRMCVSLEDAINACVFRGTIDKTRICIQHVGGGHDLLHDLAVLTYTAPRTQCCAGDGEDLPQSRLSGVP